MAVVRPFQGIVYDPQRVDPARVVAPPYDVITPNDRVHYYARDPRNVVRLIAGEVTPTDDAANNKYTRAAAFFGRWFDEGVLRREPDPCVYVYRQHFEDPADGRRRSRTGVLAVVRLERFGEGVFPHERTHARPKADQTSLTHAVDANLSPVFSLFTDPDHRVRALTREVEQGVPWLGITTEERERHEIWRVHDRARLRALARALEPSPLFIADGHHRYETALRYRDRQRREHPQAPPEAAFNFVLTLLVDATDPDLRILPTHRLLRDLSGFDPGRLLDWLARVHAAVRVPDRQAFLKALQEPVAAHRLGVALPDGGLLIVDLPRQPQVDPVAALDVSVLHRTILEPELGIHEGVLESERHLAYTRDPLLALDEVEGGRAQAAFLLRAPEVADVLAVARAGSMMPQKSTYFYPKPLSGIVFNPLDPQTRIEAA
ncbi:MAG TPA: DUF1015 domain-containing protein [Candidatus Limnocylindrales bacterium]|nr:DUF1015 domain-containing protein [Candidatus Limnocylindrales bacterium]